MLEFGSAASRDRLVLSGEQTQVDVYEDGSVYLPEGLDVVNETDFRMASATNRFWRLVRVEETT